MLRIGIDEAGLGPMLGPLVVAGAAFRIADGAGSAAGGAAPFAVDLLGRLSAAIAAPGRRAAGRIVVGDSKQVYGVTHDLGALETAVLAFAAVRDGGDGRVPATLDELHAAVGADSAERHRLPWYAGAAPSLPLRAGRDDVIAAATRLRAALDDAGVTFVGFRADVVPETRLNAGLARTENKSDVLFEHVAGTLDGFLACRAATESAGVAIDRQGGRRFYLAPLLRRWPQCFAWALEESPTLSRYRLGLGDAEAEVRFVVGGDAEHVEIGLASMAAKYLRELHMEVWNAYFATVCPGVARTAGYTVDARRWLDATRGARLAAGIPDDRLVRAR